MRNFFKFILITLFAISAAQFANCYATNDQAMSSEEAKQFVKTAVTYALENMDPNMDYSKYVSKDFINSQDGEIFNYDQWIAHQKKMKELVKSMTPIFDSMIAEGDHVAATFKVHFIKKNGSELDVKEMAFFEIKNQKIVHVEELTQLVDSREKEKNVN